MSSNVEIKKLNQMIQLFSVQANDYFSIIAVTP